MTSEEWKQYYSDNLILQYKQKTKALDTIQTLVSVNYLLNILELLKLVWDIENSKGDFLDIIGQLLGLSRTYFGLNLDGCYFSTPFARDGGEGNDIVNHTPLQAGFYSEHAKEEKFEGKWFTHKDANYTLYELEDDSIDEENLEDGIKKYGDYRKIVKMKIFSRTCNNSLYEINEYLRNNFDGVSATEEHIPLNQIIYNTSSEKDFKLFCIMRDNCILPCVAGVECVVDI